MLVLLLGTGLLLLIEAVGAAVKTSLLYSQPVRLTID